MKILVTTSTFPVDEHDEVPNFVLEQIEALANLKEKHEIVVVVPHNAYSDAPEQTVVRPTHTEIRYHYFWPHGMEKLAGRGIMPSLKSNPFRIFLLPFFCYFQYRAVCKECEQNSPDVLYAHWFTPQALIAYLVNIRTGVPFIFTTHASDVHIWRKIPLATKLISYVLRRAAHFTAVSTVTAKKLSSFFDEHTWDTCFSSKLSIVPMGIHAHNKVLVESTLSHILENLGVDRNKFLILSLGRIESKKGINILLEAFFMMPEAVKSECQLIIAGDGSLRKDMQILSTKLDLGTTIVFTGYVTGTVKKALLQCADLFVLPSIVDRFGDAEGLPVTLLEALSAGKQIIASDESGAEEVIGNKFGRIVRAKSNTELLKAMLEVFELTDEEANKEKLMASLCAEDYDWSIIAAKHLKILENAIK